MIAMPFISVRDIQIYYEIHGKGPPLLSISGTGGDLRSSPSIFETPLAQHFKILAYDQRGLGQTSRPDIPYSMADYADDADGVRDIAQGLDDVISEELAKGRSIEYAISIFFNQRHQAFQDYLNPADTDKNKVSLYIFLPEPDFFHL